MDLKGCVGSGEETVLPLLPICHCFPPAPCSVVAALGFYCKLRQNVQPGACLSLSQQFCSLFRSSLVSSSHSPCLALPMSGQLSAICAFLAKPQLP